MENLASILATPLVPIKDAIDNSRKPSILKVYIFALAVQVIAPLVSTVAIA
jgi:hypothetical protein